MAAHFEARTGSGASNSTTTNLNQDRGINVGTHVFVSFCAQSITACLNKDLENLHNKDRSRSGISANYTNVKPVLLGSLLAASLEPPVGFG
jgi:hypothetical protein